MSDEKLEKTCEKSSGSVQAESVLRYIEVSLMSAARDRLTQLLERMWKRLTDDRPEIIGHPPIHPKH